MRPSSSTVEAMPVVEQTATLTPFFFAHLINSLIM